MKPMTAIAGQPPPSPARRVWLDPLSPDMLASGELLLSIDDGVGGAVYRSRPPSIAADAITAGPVPTLPGKSRQALALARHRRTVADAIDAADLFRPSFEASGGSDGFVCVAISADDGRDPRRALEEANRLWNAIARPNILIGIPGTRANLPVVRRLLTAGFNIEITGIYGADRYREAARAHLSAMQTRVAAQEPVHDIVVLATAPLCRIDRGLSALLGTNVAQEGVEALPMRPVERGGIASAVLLYRESCIATASAEFLRLQRFGLRPLRVHCALSAGEASDAAYAHDIAALLRAGVTVSMPAPAAAAWLRNGERGTHRRSEADDRDFRDAETVTDRLLHAGIDMTALVQRAQPGALPSGGARR